jgi:hypothetical protein
MRNLYMLHSNILKLVSDYISKLHFYSHTAFYEMNHWTMSHSLLEA